MSAVTPSRGRSRRADVARYCARKLTSRAKLDAVALVAVRRLCRIAVARLKEEAAQP